ncbi:MAG: FCD domain-containing protein [Betaproteobacteria bacterium]|nr:MAG: FCD domain-containing protein [Betaproteobacteria bacterium]
MLGPSKTAERAAYDYLREQILSGGFAGGQPIVQQEIANHLGLSRIPVRDALKHLSAEGLVSIESNRRVIVTKMTLNDVREIFLMRGALEGVAARAAVTNLSPTTLERLSMLVDRMESCESNTSEWLRIHEEFHSLICIQSRMPRLQSEIQRLSAALEPYLRVFLVTHGMAELRESKHRSLVSALKKRDPELAELTLRDHIERAFNEIWTLINRAKTLPAGKKSRSLAKSEGAVRASGSSR